MTIDEMLAAARARLDRPDPHRAATMVAGGAILVDTRPGWQRAQEGGIPGVLVIERNHVEWRLDPTSVARLPQAVDHDVTWACATPPTSTAATGPGRPLSARRRPRSR